MYEGWLINWRDEFEVLLSNLRDEFEEIYSKKVMSKDSEFQKLLISAVKNDDIEKYNMLKIISLNLKPELLSSINILNECFTEQMGWALRNISIICFAYRIIQTYAVLSFFVKNANSKNSGKLDLMNLGKVTDEFFDEHQKSIDIVSIRRAMSVIYLPFDHFCPGKNYSKSVNFYSPEFLVTGTTFVKDSIKINKFDLTSDNKFNDSDDFESQVLSTFKTSFNVLEYITGKIKELK